MLPVKRLGRMSARPPVLDLTDEGPIACAEAVVKLARTFHGALVWQASYVASFYEGGSLHTTHPGRTPPGDLPYDLIGYYSWEIYGSFTVNAWAVYNFSKTSLSNTYLLYALRYARGCGVFDDHKRLGTFIKTVRHFLRKPASGWGALEGKMSERQPRSTAPSMM